MGREWHLADDGVVWEALEEGPTPICECEDLDDDALLIAAAPDLLAACEAALGFFIESDLGDSHLAGVLRDAIAKAKRGAA